MGFIFNKTTLERMNKIRDRKGLRPLTREEVERYYNPIGVPKKKGIADTVNSIRDAETKGDTRYNEPKKNPKASEETIEETVEQTEIYKRAKEHILNAQKKQVGYGLDKYPEPLNADTWSMIETIDHIIDESVDKLHYLVMLRIQLERAAEKDLDIFKKTGIIGIDNEPHYYNADTGEFTPVDIEEDQISDFSGGINFKITYPSSEPNNPVPVMDGDGVIRVTLDASPRHDHNIDAIANSIREVLKTINEK